MGRFSTGYIKTIAVLKDDVLFACPINAQIIRQRIDCAADTELNTLGFFLIDVGNGLTCLQPIQLARLRCSEPTRHLTINRCRVSVMT